jgi:hypothetical protein
VLIGLHSDALPIDARHRRVLVIERFFGFLIATSLFRDNACVGMSGLMGVDRVDASGLRILFRLLANERELS